MRFRLVILTLIAVAAFVACTPADAQFVQGQVDLTYDSSDQTVQIYAETDADTGMADSYLMWLSVDVSAQDPSGNSTLVYHNRWSAANGDSMITSPAGLSLDASPGMTYSATATHGYYFTVTDPVYGVGYFDDIYGFSVMGLVEATGPLMRVSPPYPFVYYVVGFAFASGRAVAKTKTQLPPTPSAALNLTKDGVFIIQNGLIIADQVLNCPGVDVATSSPNSSGAQLPCAFFGFASGDASQTPQVPSLKAWLTGVNHNLSVAWTVPGFQFARPDSGVRADGTRIPCDRLGTAPQPYSDGGVGVSWTTTPSDSSHSYEITTSLGIGPANPNQIKGGIIALTWQIGNSAPLTYNVGLWGADPDRSTVKNRLAQSPLGAPWWREYMVQQESSWHQFNLITGLRGTPNFGPPCGFGLTQQDPPGQFTSPYPYYGDAWNWQVNVDDGIKEMLVKQSDGQRAWKAAVQAWNDDPNRTKNFPCNTIIGNFTFCYEVKAGVKSYADANAIKAYNGGSTFILYGKTDQNPAQHWYVTNQDYLNKVLTQVILP